MIDSSTIVRRVLDGETFASVAASDPDLTARRVSRRFYKQIDKCADLFADIYYLDKGWHYRVLGHRGIFNVRIKKAFWLELLDKTEK